MKLKHSLFIISCSIFLFASCSVSKQISKQASTILLSDTAISTGHIGISIYEPATNTYWYNYNATKNFIPASNTKLFTLYAGMKYLGDSLVGMRYAFYNALSNRDGNVRNLVLSPSGDPTFLNAEFSYQPVYNFLRNADFNNFTIEHDSWQTNSLGKGWAWDDYNSAFMVERSAMPVYGNVLKIELEKVEKNSLRYFELEKRNTKRDGSIIPVQNYYLKTTPSFFEKILNTKADFRYFSAMNSDGKIKMIRRQASNIFDFEGSSSAFVSLTVPFFTKLDSTVINYPENENSVASKILSELMQKREDFQGISHRNNKNSGYFRVSEDKRYLEGPSPEKHELYTIHSQPSDSLFKPMMHRSDNFFAEQTLLMASNEYLGYMSDEKMIDTILKTSLNDLPQKPKWMDGSGLSRYNLCTPQTLVYLLNKMKNEFGWERVKNILPTGGSGTLSSYYKKDSSFIYAKTGTLSNNCALSGYLITQQGKFLIFSVLVNNYQGGATPVRKAVEKFLLSIRNNY